MAFLPVAALDPAAMEWVDRNPQGSKWVSIKVLNRDPESGAELWLTNEHAGFRGGIPGHGHYLPVDEEAYFLSGFVSAGPETEYSAGDYLFFPAGFVHSPTKNDIDTMIVIRTSGPMSYVDVPNPSPQGFLRADERGMLEGQANSRRPISHLATGDLPWETVYVDGSPTGERVKILSEDRRSGAATFLWQVPAGWQSPLPRRELRHGREWFIVEGDYRTGGPDSVTLSRHWYRRVDGGAAAGGGEGSTAGCTALCWADGPLIGGGIVLG